LSTGQSYPTHACHPVLLFLALASDFCQLVSEAFPLGSGGFEVSLELLAAVDEFGEVFLELEVLVLQSVVAVLERAVGCS